MIYTQEAAVLRSVRWMAENLLRQAPATTASALPTRRRQAVELRHQIHELRIGRPDGLSDAAWADWLTQRGDPRGEALALVLAALRAFDTRACEGTQLTPPTTDTPPLASDSTARIMALCEAPESSGAGLVGLMARVEWVCAAVWGTGGVTMPDSWRTFLLSSRSIRRQRYGGPPDWVEYYAVMKERA